VREPVGEREEEDVQARDGVRPVREPASGVPVLGWILGIGLLVALAVLIQVSVGWRALLAPWREIPAGNLLAASVLVVGSYALRSVRIHQYFQPATRGGFLRVFRVMLLHNLFNNVLPARSGEASFPILMKRTFGVPLTHSLPALVYLRFLDLHFVLVLGAGTLLASRGAGGMLVLAALATLPWLVFLGQSRLGRRLAEPRGRLGRTLAAGLSGLPGSPRLFWVIWGWTALNWTAKLLVFAWVLQAFLPMPFATALVGSVTGELSSILPIHGLAGAGTYEGGILVGLVPLGIGTESALGAAVNLHLFVLGVSVLSALLALLLPAASRLPAHPDGSAGARGDSPG
jgi:uncharacterized membrane protein YbhN (UPF0104 family)